MLTPTSFRRALAAGRDFRRGSMMIDRRRREVDDAPPAPRVTERRPDPVALRRAA